MESVDKVNNKKNDPFWTDKPLYDYSIEYDISRLPNELKEMIEKLEEYDKEGNWFDYDILFDDLEITAKSCCRNRIIEEYDYKIILRKYGGLYD